MRGRWLFDIERDYLSARHLDLKRAEHDNAALHDADPGALLERAVLAAGRRDLGEMLAAGGVLHRRGLLTDDLALTYSGALRAEGRLAEAAAVMGEQIAKQSEPHGLDFPHAELLAADGQFAAARAAADRALARDPTNPKIANLRRRAKWLSRFLEAPPGELTWEQGRLLVEGCLILRAETKAVEALTGFMAAPPAGAPSMDDAVGIARAAHKIGLQALVRPMVDRLWEQAADDEAVRVLRIQALAMAGETAAAVGLAAEAPPLADDATLSEAAAPLRRALRYVSAEALTVNGQLEPALRILGAQVTSDRRDFLPLTALQRVMGQYVLSTLDLPWAPPRPPKVINILPFYNEVALLEMRLQEMGDWVDHFVVVEATTTFTGQPKPLHFEQIRPSYADRGDQLLHAAVRDMPDCMDTAWARDFYQRDMGVSALAGIWRPDDIILITDADEIVDRRALDHWPHLASLRMATSKFFLDYCAEPGNARSNRRSGAICRADTLARYGVTYVRTALSAQRKDWDTVPQAGWHFSSIGDADKVTQKLNAYAHQEVGKTAMRDHAMINDQLQAIRDGQYEPGWTRYPLDARFPRYVRDNRDLLAPILLGE